MELSYDLELGMRTCIARDIRCQYVIERVVLGHSQEKSGEPGRECLCR